MRSKKGVWIAHAILQRYKTLFNLSIAKFSTHFIEKKKKEMKHQVERMMLIIDIKK